MPVPLITDNVVSQFVELHEGTLIHNMSCLPPPLLSPVDVKNYSGQQYYEKIR